MSPGGGDAWRLDLTRKLRDGSVSKVKVCRAPEDRRTTSMLGEAGDRRQPRAVVSLAMLIFLTVKAGPLGPSVTG